MRILEVCQPTVEGVALHVEVLASRLPELGVEVTVACPPGPLADHIVARGVPWMPVEMGREVDLDVDLRAVRQLVRRLHGARRAGVGFDLVHAHSAKAGAVARVAAALARVPAVYTPHAWSFLAASDRIDGAVYRATELLLTRVSRRIICVSQAEQRLGRQVGAQRRSTVIPNGVAAPRAPSGRAGQGSDVVVGTVGRLAPQKGIDLLLDVAASVCAERPSVRFRIAGDGPSGEVLRTEVERRDLGRYVRFDGLVDGPWGVLDEIDVFALPSRWEGMPFTLLEAMSCGLPVVSFDVGGVRDLIVDAEHGAVVPAGDVDAFAEAVLHYVDAPEERRRVGRAARARVLSGFTLDRMVARTHAVYAQVLGVEAPRGAAASAPTERRG